MTPATTGPATDHERRAVEELRARIRADYRDSHEDAWIREVIDQALHRFAHARIRDFVPLLVERAARDTLNATGGRSGGGNGGDEGRCRPGPAGM